MHPLFNDLKSGLRSLRRMPGSAVISVVVLALGIGLCAFMFSVVYGVFYRGLDVPEAERLFVVYQTLPEEDDFNLPVRIQDFVDLRERQSSFEGLFAVSGGAVNVSDGESAWRLEGASVTANTFDVLRVQPVLGRAFAAGEDAPGAPPHLVLGFSAWRDHFGMDEGVIGRTVRVNGEPAEILGVMPEGFAFPFNNDAWVPLRDDPLASAREEGPMLAAFARLADGVTRGQAELELTALAEQLAREHPDTNGGRGARLETPSRAATGGELLVIFSALMAAVFCVLLVACANVANLLLARAATRTKEAAVRAALGGSRMRVMAPFLAESLALAAAGALLGIFVAQAAIFWFDGVTDPARTGRPYFIRFTIDWPILAFIAGLTGVTALAAGLAPAWKVARTDPDGVLKDQARGSSGLRIGRMSKVLVTAEVALSCALLVAAGLMTKSILKLGDVAYPFETDGLFTARLAPQSADYPDRAARARLWEELLGELAALPEVAAVGLATQLPMAGSARVPIAIDGVVYEDAEALPSVNRSIVSTGYFDALGVSVTAGRGFSAQDALGSERVAVVNASLVERYFAGTNPIGRQLKEGLADTLPRITVVGVVPDLNGPRPPGVDDFEPAAYYLPLSQSDAQGLNIAALPRSGAALDLTPHVRAAVGRVDAELPIFNVWTQAEIIDRSTWFFGVFGTVFIVFGAAALFMASVGLYGVLSFAVSRRTQEMGIRMAMGANTRDVVTLVVRQGANQLGIGLALGLALAFGVTRVIGVLMYEVDPQDPAVFAGALATIVVVGVAASVVPARRAGSVDPLEALRNE
jgi:predicted permease